LGTIHYGFNEHNMGFPGTVSIREYVFVDFCYDVAHSMVRSRNDPFDWGRIAEDSARASN